ncbi:MAG TPA: hypothetical protein VH370_12590, partial [Humisphaera sp.]|nr:hypothetical protein [Humisphaera sp.]
MTLGASNVRLFSFALALLLLLGLFSSPALALEPDQIALLVNKNVPEGRKLAEFYAQQRHIPDGRIIEVDLPAPDPASFPELITPAMYDARVVPVVRDFLTKGGFDRKVICVVSFWGMPLRILPREIPELAKAERTALEAQLKDELTPKLQRDVSAMEALARELNPKFQAGAGNEVPQLSARLSTAMHALYVWLDAGAHRSADWHHAAGGVRAAAARERAAGIPAAGLPTHPPA